MKAMLLTILTAMTLLGCGAEKSSTLKPTNEDLKLAFEVAIKTLNDKTGSRIEYLDFDWMEINEECYGELDYFAQQFLWAYIYQEELIKNQTFLINCNVPKSYRKTNSTTEE
jgi:hypothetical protein